MRKFKKTSNLMTYAPRGYLSGHLFSYGRIGSGKSVSTLSLIQGYKDLYGYKIWYFYGGERSEQLYVSLPSVDEEYWNKVCSLGRFDEPGPKQYKVRFLYPYFGSKMPKKLPQKKIKGELIVDSKMFTIPLKSVIVEDISTVVGVISEASRFCWNEILERANKKDNSGSLIDIACKVKGIANTPLYKNFIIPMSREKFLMDNYSETNLDLVDEAKDKDVITCLCLEFVPKVFHPFIINWIFRTSNDLLDENKIPKKNIGFIVEASTFFRATDDSVMDDRLKIFRANMANYMRMARRGFFLALDTQSPSETRGILSGSDDIMLMFKTTAWRDKEEMCDPLKRENRMRQDQIADLAFLEPGCCYLAETGRNVIKVRMTLPRTMYWKKEYGNFYKNVWPKYEGEWKNTEETIDFIHQRCEKRHEEVQPKKKEEKPIIISHPEASVLNEPSDDDFSKEKDEFDEIDKSPEVEESPKIETQVEKIEDIEDKTIAQNEVEETSDPEPESKPKPKKPEKIKYKEPVCVL